MQRITFSLDEALISEIDRYAASRGVRSRSETIRDMVRAGMEQSSDLVSSRNCAVAVIYVYDTTSRELPKRLARIFRENHRLLPATFHIHLDPKTCMEVTMLRGPASEVVHCSERALAERGVRHGRIVTVPLLSKPEKSRTT